MSSSSMSTYNFDLLPIISDVVEVGFNCVRGQVMTTPFFNFASSCFCLFYILFYNGVVCEFFFLIKIQSISKQHKQYIFQTISSVYRNINVDVARISDSVVQNLVILPDFTEVCSFVVFPSIRCIKWQWVHYL
jgi:hypothetical protein